MSCRAFSSSSSLSKQVSGKGRMKGIKVFPSYSPCYSVTGSFIGQAQVFWHTTLMSDVTGAMWFSSVCYFFIPHHQCLHLYQWAQQDQGTDLCSDISAHRASQLSLVSQWPAFRRKGMDIFWGDSMGQGLFPIGDLDLDNLFKDRRV